MLIVTHVRPDIDAVAATWLILRHVVGHDRVRIGFVAANDPDDEALDRASYIVDVGMDYYPEEGRFDHHQDPTLRSATWLVWEWLRERGAPVEHLRPLIELIDAEDRGFPINDSCETGLHAMFHGALLNMHGREYDMEAFRVGEAMLDAIAAHLKDAATAAAELDRKIVWRSPCGQVAAIRDGSLQHTKAAFARGIPVVVFQSGGTAIGIRRTPERPDINVGKCVAALHDDAEMRGDRQIAEELAYWYRHPAGFYAGRGTAVAPREDPVPPGALETIARRLVGVLR